MWKWPLLNLLAMRNNRHRISGPPDNYKIVKAFVFLIFSLKETVGHLVLEWRKKYQTATYSAWLNPNDLCNFLGPFAIVAICFLLRVYVICWALTLFFIIYLYFQLLKTRLFAMGSLLSSLAHLGTSGHKPGCRRQETQG
jgi:hypothetical protein